MDKLVNKGKSKPPTLFNKVLSFAYFLRVVDALVAVRKEYICHPSEDRKRKTAENMEKKYGLPHFYAAIDGMLVPFLVITCLC